MPKYECSERDNQVGREGRGSSRTSSAARSGGGARARNHAEDGGDEHERRSRILLPRRTCCAAERVRLVLEAWRRRRRTGRRKSAGGDDDRSPPLADPDGSNCAVGGDKAPRRSGPGRHGPCAASAPASCVPGYVRSSPPCRVRVCRTNGRVKGHCNGLKVELSSERESSPLASEL